MPYNATIRCALGGKIGIIDCNQASMTTDEQSALERPHLEPGPTPEERAQMEQEEERYRRAWPELADARFGPEPSPEETQAELDDLARQEDALRHTLDNLRKVVKDVVQDRIKKREHLEKLTNLEDALKQVRARQSSLTARLIRMNIRGQPPRRRR